MNQKKPILIICDELEAPTGVGIQAFTLCQHLIATDKYRFINLAAFPPDEFKRRRPPVKIYRPGQDDKKISDGWVEAGKAGITVENAVANEDVVIMPCEGFAHPQYLANVVQLIRKTYQDTLHIIFVSDPRFYANFWPIIEAVRKQKCKMHYWHVWDNGPTPFFNKYILRAADTVMSISKNTHEGLELVAATMHGEEHSQLVYAPHAYNEHGPFVPLNLDKTGIDQIRRKWFKTTFPEKFVLFWDNKNFWRKLPGQLLFAFAVAKQTMPHLALVLKTNAVPFVQQEAGQDLIECAVRMGLKLGEDIVFVDNNTLSNEQMNQLYNATDCTINIAHSEGFGLSTLCAMMAGRPIIATATGGMRTQLGLPTIYDPEGKGPGRHEDHVQSVEHGVAIWPNNRHIIGSPPAPYIWEEHCHIEDIAAAMVRVVERSQEEGAYFKMCKAARAFALDNFSIHTLAEKFIDVLNDDQPWQRSLVKVVDPLKSSQGMIDLEMR